jgi:protein SCO1
MRAVQTSGLTVQNGRRWAPAAAGVRLPLCVGRYALSMTLAVGPALSSLSAQQQPGLAGSDVERPGISAGTVPPQLADVTFEQRLGHTLPLDVMLRDEGGRVVALGDYFGRRPVVLAFVYYQCPMLCSQTMNGISTALKVLPFTPGEDFDVVLVSFDPRDTPEAATAKKQAHLVHWSAQQTAPAWHFLTGDEAAIRRVTAAAGFTYRWDERTGQFAHVSGLLVATPDGRLSRYFYGVEYSPKELRLALVESGEGRIGSAIDQLLLYCYHYNPQEGRYGVIVMNVVRLGGALTVVMLGTFLVVMRRRETRGPVHRQA